MYTRCTERVEFVDDRVIYFSVCVSIPYIVSTVPAGFRPPSTAQGLAIYPLCRICFPVFTHCVNEFRFNVFFTNFFFIPYSFSSSRTLFLYPVLFFFIPYSFSSSRILFRHPVLFFFIPYSFSSSRTLFLLPHKGRHVRVLLCRRERRRLTKIDECNFTSLMPNNPAWPASLSTRPILGGG